MGDAEVHELAFLLFREGRAFLALVIRQRDFLHRRYNSEGLRNEIKDTAERKMKLLGSSVLALVHNGKQVLLNYGTSHVLDERVAKLLLEVVACNSFVLLIGGRLDGLLLDGEPLIDVGNFRAFLISRLLI